MFSLWFLDRGVDGRFSVWCLNRGMAGIIYFLFSNFTSYSFFFFQICPWDAELREIRAECYLAVGENFKAISDIRSTTKLISDNTDAYLKLSLIHYQMGDADDSLM